MKKLLLISLILVLSGCVTVQHTEDSLKDTIVNMLDRMANDCLVLAVNKCESMPDTIWHKVMVVEYEEDGIKAAHAFCAFDPGEGYVWLWDRKGSTETFMYPTAKLDGLAFMGLWSRKMFTKDLTEIKKVRFIEKGEK